MSKRLRPIEHMYAYRTGRTDGLDYCVGVVFGDTLTPTINGMYALFTDRADALAMLETHAARGVRTLALRSTDF